jgi:D-psicose/D-tagatose/L-ribulose 3-epimerase
MSVLNRDILISFFMFTTNLEPGSADYARTIVTHMEALLKIGYDGFDLPIAPPAGALNRDGDLKLYEELRKTLDKADLNHLRLTTNVYATPAFDPSSSSTAQRKVALEYLKSRVDITNVLGGDIMAGPIVLPYGVFPTDWNVPLWSDALQDWVVERYRNAMPVLEKLGDHAVKKGVKVAIEPVGHWETPAPNLLSDLLSFLNGVPNIQVGGCVDTAQVVIGSDNVGTHVHGMKQLLEARRLHYVHLSAPDRGALKDSWIPWRQFLEPVFQGFEGPYLVEVFNAIPAFLNGLRITRRKFWIPGEDDRVAGVPDAYTVAQEALTEVRRQFEALSGGG